MDSATLKLTQSQEPLQSRRREAMPQGAMLVLRPATSRPGDPAAGSCEACPSRRDAVILGDPIAVSTADPLILTAAFDGEAAAAFQRLRDAHFPPRLNVVPAHLTLFHHLPGGEHHAIRARLSALGGAGGPISFTAPGLRFLGRGVAFAIEAEPLVTRRKALADEWRDWLTPQDAQGFRPHVTIQNKVDPSEARALRDTLLDAFPIIGGAIVGLDLWHYRGGPWERAGRFPFVAGG